MPLFQSIKRAFGFSDPEMEEAELEGIDATVVPRKSRIDSPDACPPQHNQPEEAPAPEASPLPAQTTARVLPSSIFESVVKVFNDALPAFLRESVDQKAQCDFLYRHLDDSMQIYLERVANEARQNITDLWNAERRQMQAQMSTLQAKLQKDEEDNNETKKLHLSAERQKRALSERVRDLEAQLQKAEAENEQLTLENKSMQNKLRVSNVLGATAPDSDQEAAKAFAQQVNELTSKLEQTSNALDDATQRLNEANTLAESRKKELDEATAARSKAENDAADSANETARLTAQNLEMKSKIEALTKAVEESRAKDNIGDAMLTDINNKYGTTKAALEAAENRCRDLEADNNKINEEYNRQKAELAQAMNDLAVVEQMQVQLSQLEDARKSNETYVKKKKEELQQATQRLQQLELENDELRHRNAQKESTIQHLEDLADSLRKTIEANLYEHAQCQSGLRAEIERLKKFKGVDNNDANASPDSDNNLPGSGLIPAEEFGTPDNTTGETSPNAKKQDSKKTKNTGKLTISAIDETIEDTDWLVSTPPEPKKKEADKDDESDFGYKAPQHKTTPDNPDQMLLF